MRIIVDTIPIGKDHYCGTPTCGDWHYDHEGTLRISVTETGNVDSDVAVALHEITEAFDCKSRGISQFQVTRFDAQFENERTSGIHAENDEPGDDPRSPYRESHSRANHVERAYCHARDLLWDEHERAVQATQ